jgi:hypothetical protein
MLDRIVKRDRLIEVRSGFRNFPHKQMGGSRDAMSDHERHGSSLLFGEHHELPGTLTQDIAIECHKVRKPFPFIADAMRFSDPGPRARADRRS